MKTCVTCKHAITALMRGAMLVSVELSCGRKIDCVTGEPPLCRDERYGNALTLLRDGDEHAYCCPWGHYWEAA